MLPTHVAIIMDGNGRWARQRHLPRVEGHRQGAESGARDCSRGGRSGVKYLTLYAFSVRELDRPKEEVDTLMKYLARYSKLKSAN
jgi:undecaprenyl diphosphate synthase